jgi:hypothetical protein
VTTTRRDDVRIGDWVRFYQGGKLVIGVVQYLPPREAWEASATAVTDIGAVHFNNILEVRHVAHED